jgi:hypothetical protein
MNELKENFFQVRDLTKIYNRGEVEVHALRGVNRELSVGEERNPEAQDDTGRKCFYPDRTSALPVVYNHLRVANDTSCSFRHAV